MSKYKFIEEARKMIGVKWRHQGRSPWAVDCVGLVVLALKGAGYDVEDRTNYSREPFNDDLQAELKQRFGEPHADPQEGDIAVFKAFTKEPSHIGIVARDRHGNLSLIHSRANMTVMEHGFDNKWQRMFVEVYRPWVS